MSVEARPVGLADLPVLTFPLALHSGLEVLRDLELLDLLLELTFDQLHENVFEVDHVRLSLVSFEFETRQHLQNVLVLDDDAVFFVDPDVLRLQGYVLHLPEALLAELALGLELLTAKRRR